MLSLGVNAGVLVVPIYDMHLFDGVLTSRSLDTLTFLSVICLAGLLLYGLVLTIRGLVLAAVGDGVASALTGPAVAAGLRAAVVGDGRAAVRAVLDVQEIRLFFGGGAAAAPFDLLCAPFLLGVLFLLHPLLGWYGLGAALILLACTCAADALARPALAEAQARMETALHDAACLLRDPVLCEGLGMEEAIRGRWRRNHGSGLASLAHAARRGEGLVGLSRLARSLLQGGMLAFTALLVTRDVTTPGVLIGANLLLSLLLQPLDQVLTHWRSVASARLAWRRVSSLLASGADATSPGAPSGDPSTTSLATQGLVLSDAAFHPEAAAEPVLHPVSLALAPGSMAVITGPNGSGKSSLLRLVAGVLRPTAGSVTLDGEASWRAAEAGRVGYLPQRPQILDGQIGENIARFRAGSGETIVEAARLGGLHGVIGRLPRGYATRVGPEDAVLSGGERQRLAFARALFGSPRLIVLDEPDASLDHAGEAVLIEALEEARRGGAAIIAVSHRRGLIAIADQVFRVERGRLSAAPHRGPMTAEAAKEVVR